MIALNPPENRKEASIGKLMPSMTMKQSTDGELCVKGPNVMQGYWNNPEATNQTFSEDGYLKTGDLATVDDQGYLSIIGRKKEMIVLSTGKNISPARVEETLKSSNFVEEILVIGDRRSYLTAIVWVSELFVQSKLTHQDLDHHLRLASISLSPYEQVKKTILVSDPFDAKYMTPTLKKKRQVIISDFVDQINALYASDL